MTNLRVPFKIPLSYNQLRGVLCVKTKQNLINVWLKKSIRKNQWGNHRVRFIVGGERREQTINWQGQESVETSLQVQIKLFWSLTRNHAKTSASSVIAWRNLLLSASCDLHRETSRRSRLQHAAQNMTCGWTPRTGAAVKAKRDAVKQSSWGPSLGSQLSLPAVTRPPCHRKSALAQSAPAGH